ncbi:MAG TPA: nitrous oxide reductase family maturation protein NosD [Sulfurospirillum arcachonense]|nr:nitrous oxide reductase family maturation protein NosD [Sulfurospirillum arcachonense]
MYKIFFVILFLFSLHVNANVLQKTIDNAPIGAIIKLSHGIYSGNIVINKPITLVGQGEKTLIKGENKGSVITINSSHVTLKNLKIIKSGNRLENFDSAIFVKDAQHINIENCVIDESLFGIFMDSVSSSSITKNKISSNGESVGLRGDAIRLWFSHNNLIKNNIIKKSRDVVLMRSHNNTIEDNQIEKGRYAIYNYHSKNNKIKNNIVKDSAVGIFVQASLDIEISKNTIKGYHGAPTSMGILLMGTSNTKVEQNILVQCNQALYIDNSPMEIDTKNWILDNKIMYSTRGLDFRGKSLQNVIRRNTLLGNMDNIMTDSHKGRTNENDITGNYWDDYEGFDLNKDNIGDNPYKKYLYLDQLWVKNPELRFFYGSPLYSMLNFLLKLAPFMEPIFVIEDKKPIFNNKF